MDLLELYIRKYKTYFVPLSIVIVGIFLVASVAYPQFLSTFEKNTELQDKDTKVANLTKLLTRIQGTNDAELENQVGTAVKALPDSKDILAIYNGISTAADKAKVTIKNFTVKVGTVFSRKPLAVAGEQAALSVSIGIESDSTESKRNFAKYLQEVLPIAEVSRLSLNPADASVDVNFYYKELNTSQLVNTQKLANPDPKKEQILQTLQNMTNP